eukprot:4922100-Pyramimonas_sp.AAC.1
MRRARERQRCRGPGAAETGRNRREAAGEETRKLGPPRCRCGANAAGGWGPTCCPRPWRPSDAPALSFFSSG